MARIDKYDPISGGFRAPLNVDTNKNSNGNPVGVGLNVNGRVVAGAGNSGIKGLLVLTQNKKASNQVDVMTHGEIVELATLTAGTTYYANATTGVLTTTATDNTYVGYTVEATRLIVRMDG